MKILLFATTTSRGFKQELYGSSTPSMLAITAQKWTSPSRSSLLSCGIPSKCGRTSVNAMLPRAINDISDWEMCPNPFFSLDLDARKCIFRTVFNDSHDLCLKWLTKCWFWMLKFYGTYLDPGVKSIWYQLTTCTEVETYLFLAVSHVFELPVLFKTCTPRGSIICENSPYRFEIKIPARLSKKYCCPLWEANKFKIYKFYSLI